MSMGLIGVCSWSLAPESPEILAKRLAETGVAGVQLALGPLVLDEPTWGREGINALAALTQSGTQLISGMMATKGEDYSSLESIRTTGGLRPDETWEYNLALGQKTAELACHLGLELVTLHAGFLPEDRDDPERVVMLDRLTQLAGLFREHNIQLGLETGQESAVTLLALLEELGCESLGVNFDPANMILYGMGDPIEALKLLAPHVLQVHVKDALPTSKPGTWGQEVPVGSGEVDWDGFFSVVADLPRVVNLVIEREAGSNRVEDIKQAATMIQAYRSEKSGVSQ